MADTEARGAETREPAAAAGLRNWAIAALLASAYTLSYVDRQILSLLVDPIKNSLAVSDTQMGFLQGVGFSLFYVLASLPLARLADTGRRSHVIAGCIATWSLMTALCGAAGSYFQLLLARVGVAAAESGLPPAAMATLSDRFDRRMLAGATSIFMLAPYVGGGIALGAGGALFSALQTWDYSRIPLIGSLAPWQLLFVIVGAPGMLFALPFLAITDKRPAEARASGSMDRWEILRLFRARPALYLAYSCAMSVNIGLLGCYIAWLPTAVQRSTGLDAGAIGTVIGPVYLIGGVAGTIAAGAFTALRRTDDVVGSSLTLLLAIAIVQWPIATLALLAPGLWPIAAMVGLSLFLVSATTCLSPLVMQLLVPPPQRAQSIALLGIISSLLGTGLAPILVGALSDLLPGGATSLSFAITIFSGIAVPAMILLLGITRRAYRRGEADRGVAPA